MKKMQSLSHCLLVSLAGTAMGALGCSHAGSNSLNNSTAAAPVHRSPAVAYQCDRYGRPLATTAAQPLVAQQPSLPPLTGGPPDAQPATLPPATPAAEQTVSTGGPAATPVLPALNPDGPESSVPKVADPEGIVQAIDRRAIDPEDSFHDRREPAPRRAFVDLTAQPWFSHAPDHSWLAGQLRFSKSDTCWRLRYASLDENDPYDGEVTLVDYPQLDCLKDGQYVRVSGHIVDPGRKEIGTAFRVSSMQTIQKSDESVPAGEGGLRSTGSSR